MSMESDVSAPNMNSTLPEDKTRDFLEFVSMMSRMLESGENVSIKKESQTSTMDTHVFNSLNKSVKTSPADTCKDAVEYADVKLPGVSGALSHKQTNLTSLRPILLYARPRCRVSCRAAFEKAVQEHGQLIGRAQMHSAVQKYCTTSAKKSDTFFCFMDGYFSHLREFFASVPRYSHRTRSAVHPLFKNCAFFTRLPTMLRMGYKHVMGDALTGKSYIPKTFTSTNLKKIPRTLKGLWFIKPAFSSMGRGIVVVNNPGNVHQIIAESSLSTKKFVVQKEVSNPHTVKGHKYDVRIWVTLRGDGYYYLHPDGRLRFSSHPYDETNVIDPGVHITNVSFQPKGDWRLEWPSRLSSLPIYDDFMNQVDTIVHDVLTACHVRAREQDLSVSPLDISGFDKQCFQVLGWDFIMDSFGKVWLLEFNTSPGVSDIDHDESVYVQWAKEALQFAQEGDLYPGVKKCEVTRRPTRVRKLYRRRR